MNELPNKKRIFYCLIFSFFVMKLSAQNKQFSPWSEHFQLTVISQSHTGFKTAYSGNNSLADSAEIGATSLTTTLFLGRKLWKAAAFYLDPEIAGGRGLNYATGVAGALNGETYRVGNPEPKLFIARAYFQQNIALKNTSYQEASDDRNQIKELIPTDRMTISAGKFAMSDFYDANKYSQDPRTQFINWSIMANAAWDYPANTRGYTFGIAVELIHPLWSLRISSVAVPRMANGTMMEYYFSKAHSETLELQKNIFLCRRPGSYKLILTGTASKAISYKSGIEAIKNSNNFLLNVISGKQENDQYRGHKFGFAFNAEQELTDELGAFSRLGWNDGKYATWAFTEVDRTACLGLSLKGTNWKRPNDLYGLAGVINGISNDHIAFLKAGGYGFIIGDGNLNYGPEKIIETYYSAQLSTSFWLTMDYQYVCNPGYNKDR